MIVFDLKCNSGHIFEASFDDSKSYENQKKKKLINCPFCNSCIIDKSVMSPNISSKSSSKKNKDKNLYSKYSDYVKTIQKEVEKNFKYVGQDFPEEARKIHYGEKKETPIYGEASNKDIADLKDEGIETVKLPWSQKKIKN